LANASSIAALLSAATAAAADDDDDDKGEDGVGEDDGICSNWSVKELM
jgi:hypothetical protein